MAFASTAGFAVGLGLLTQGQHRWRLLRGGANLGAADGSCMGVDLALVFGVLPNPEDSAKDLGVFGIANPPDRGPRSWAPRCSPSAGTRMTPCST